MLTSTEIDFVKHGGREASALAQSRDGVRTLNKTLSSLEQEKARSIKELEINRQKFLRSHHSLVPKTVVIRRGSALIDQQKKIEDAKEDQRQCQVSLKQRKDEFMDALKKRPLSNNIFTRNRRVEKLEALRVAEERKTKLSTDFTLRNDGMELLQRRFQTARQQKVRERPFQNSVNVILEKLKGERKQAASSEKQKQQDKFDTLTRHILSTYAGIDADPDAQNKRDKVNNSKQEQRDPDTHLSSGEDSEAALIKPKVENTTPDSPLTSTAGGIVSNLGQMHVNYSNGRGHSTDTKAAKTPSPISPNNDYTPCRSSASKTHGAPQDKLIQREVEKKLQQRGREQAEKKQTDDQTEETHTQTNQVDISIHVIPPVQTSSRLQPSYSSQANGKGLPRVTKGSPSSNRNSVTTSREGSLSPKRPSSPRSPRLLSCDNFPERENQRSRSRVHTWSSGQQSRKESLTPDFRRRKSMCGDLDVASLEPESTDKAKSDACNAIAIVHDDDSGEDRLRRRKSIFSVDALEDKQLYHKEDSDSESKTGSKNGISVDKMFNVNTKLAFSKNESEEGKVHKNLINKEDNLRCDELDLNLETSSARSESTIASLTDCRSRLSHVGRKDGSAGGRRVSVQTDGALRLWASVQRQEADAEDGPDSTAYRMAVDSVVSAAACVDEQVQRLENVRRSSLSRYPLELYRRSSLDATDEKSKIQRMRRGSVTEPSKPTADVRDEVYKFLQKKFSKSELRRMSMSSLDSQMHSGTTLDDITGRRSSPSQPAQSRPSSSRKGSAKARFGAPAVNTSGHHEQSALNEVRKLTAAMDSVRGTSRRNSTAATPSSISRASPSVGSMAGFAPGSTVSEDVTSRKPNRSYSWAPDVSSTQDWHILALELLARNRNGSTKFRTIRDLLQGLADEYQKQTSAMMYEELYYCTYLRIPNRLLPPDLSESDITSVFEHSL